MTQPQMQMSRMDMSAISENAAPDASRLAALTIGADPRGVKPRAGTQAPLSAASAGFKSVTRRMRAPRPASFSSMRS